MSANKVFINNDGLLEICVIGDQTRESVVAMGAAARPLLEDLAARQEPRLILDDITALGKTDTPARQAVAQLARELPYEKAAMVGDGGALLRVGTQLLLQAIGLGGKIKYFDNRAAAIKWLHN